jgi:AP endonuclease-1
MFVSLRRLGLFAIPPPPPPPSFPSFCLNNLSVSSIPSIAMAPKKRSADSSSSKGNGEAATKKLNRTDSDFESLNFDNDCKTKEGGNTWNFKISSWNVDGMRAWAGKGGMDFVKHEKPDVICFQETKCNEKKAPEAVVSLDLYPHRYWHSSTAKEGYSGVAMFSKTEPISVEYGFGEEDDIDAEGRLITAEFDTFYLVTTYVPNAGRKLVTLDKRMDWDPLLRKHLKELDEKKPVVLW